MILLSKLHKGQNKSIQRCRHIIKCGGDEDRGIGEKCEKAQGFAALCVFIRMNLNCHSISREEDHETEIAD